MSAKRDDNPPDDWANKIINLPEEGKEESDAGEISSKYRVTDRRHWAEQGEESTEDAQAPVLRPPAYVEALEEEIKKKDATLKEYISQYKAAKSQMNEAISRIEREKSREVNFRIAELARAFLSILDDLDAATDHAKKENENSPVAQGLILISQRIKSTLDGIGIVEIECLGKAHDPAFHEAVAVEPVEGPEKDGLIIEVLKKGYTLGDVLVRPSAVVVGKFE